jgi:hypothetical protein
MRALLRGALRAGGAQAPWPPLLDDLAPPPMPLPLLHAAWLAPRLWALVAAAVSLVLFGGARPRARRRAALAAHAARSLASRRAPAGRAQAAHLARAPPPGLMSGLTLGLFSLSRMELHTLRESGTPTQRADAARILPVCEPGRAQRRAAYPRAHPRARAAHAQAPTPSRAALRSCWRARTCSWSLCCYGTRRRWRRCRWCCAR